MHLPSVGAWPQGWVTAYLLHNGSASCVSEARRRLNHAEAEAKASPNRANEFPGADPKPVDLFMDRMKFA